MLCSVAVTLEKLCYTVSQPDTRLNPRYLTDGDEPVNDSTLSLIVPVHNAAVYLSTLVEDCLLVVPHHFTDYEIILIDDGSSDNSRLTAEHQAATHDPVMVLNHTRAQGYGRAVMRGLRAARGDYILVMDSGSQISVSEISRLMHYVGTYDILTGYGIQLHRPWDQHIQQTLLTRLVNQMLSLELQTIAHGLVLASADLWRHLDLCATTWLINAEIHARARQQQIPCIEVGLHHDPRLEQQRHKTQPMLTTRALWEAWQLRSTLRRSSHRQDAQWRKKAMVQIGTMTATRDK